MRCAQVGRTARAGRCGVSVSLAGEAERALVKAVVRRARRPVKSRAVPPDIVDKYRRKLERLEPEIGELYFFIIYLAHGSLFLR